MNPEILEKHGLSPLEWVALTGPRTEYLETLDKLALYAVRICEPGDVLEEEVPTADGFREALLGLIKRGWLMVYTEPPEVRATRLSARKILFPPLDPRVGVGCIDLTPYGYRQCLKILEDLRGFKIPERESAGVAWADDEAHTYTCIAETRRACQSWVEELLSPLGDHLSFWFSNDIRVVGVQEPERVGAWKSCEAGRTYPKGWRIVISVRRVRRQRFFLPEWQAKGWITPGEYLQIDGEIQGIRFRFYETAEVRSWEDRTPVYQTRLIVRDGKALPTERVYTTLHGVKTFVYTAGTLRDTHFEWEDTEKPKRTRPLTIPEALICLQEGFSAWKSTRANTPEA